MKNGNFALILCVLLLTASQACFAVSRSTRRATAGKVEVKKVERLSLSEDVRRATGKVCGMESDGRHILLTDPSNRGLYRYSVVTKRAKSVSTEAGAGYGVRASKRGLKRVYDYQYQVPDMPKPFGENEGYLWTSVSPNGEKCLFFVSGYGAFVCRMDGSELQRIGDLHAARWLSDELVVGMMDKDDGLAVVESTIVVYNLTDGRLQHLTDAALKLMYPYADANGKKIACSADNGDIYLISLR